MTLFELLNQTEFAINLFKRDGEFINSFWVIDNDLTKYLNCKILDLDYIADKTMNIVINY